MSRYKCVICGDYIEDGGDKVAYKGRYAHRECFNIAVQSDAEEKRKEQALKAAQRKRTKKTKDAEGNTVVQVKQVTKNKTKEEIEDEKLFFAYIKELTGRGPDVKTLTLAKKYSVEFGLKYIDLVTALKYIYEIEEREFDPENIAIGLVPYKVDKAKKYYASLEETINKNKAINTNSFYETEIVNIKRIRKRRTETIDMTELREG